MKNEITFEIDQPETTEESIINTIILLVRDIKQFKQFKNTEDFQAYKETNNRLVNDLMLSVRQLYI